MGVFYVHVEDGRVATFKQLIEAGVATEAVMPELPWHRIQGTGDASTLWYAVLRRKERGVFMGNLVLRHSGHYASLLDRGWEEVPVETIGEGVVDRPGPAPADEPAPPG